MTINILVADDHAVMRDGLKLIFGAQSDFSVVGVAANGREAVQLAGQLQPDVVVLDIAMPELNGIEAARQICRDLPRAGLVILSMHANQEHLTRAFQAGARGYVLKESAGNEVVDAVRAVSRGQRYLSQKLKDLALEGVLDLEAASATSPLERLSAREREVLQLVAEGKSSADIAANLNLSPKTIETYRSRLMEKLGLHDIPALVKFALQYGLIHLD